MLWEISPFPANATRAVISVSNTEPEILALMWPRTEGLIK